MLARVEAPDEGGVMFARVATYSGAADRLLEGFGRAQEPLSQADGLVNAYLCINREDGKALTITVWETKDALEASAEQAHQLRSRATEPSGATTDSVTNYEVVLTVEPAKSAA
jgi:heme-degrading monooxygenase HmoA